MTDYNDNKTKTILQAIEALELANIDRLVAGDDNEVMLAAIEALKEEFGAQIDELAERRELFANW